MAARVFSAALGDLAGRARGVGRPIDGFSPSLRMMLRHWPSAMNVALDRADVVELGSLGWP